MYAEFCLLYWNLAVPKFGVNICFFSLSLQNNMYSARIKKNSFIHFTKNMIFISIFLLIINSFNITFFPSNASCIETYDISKIYITITTCFLFLCIISFVIVFNFKLLFFCTQIFQLLFLVLFFVFLVFVSFIYLVNFWFLSMLVGFRIKTPKQFSFQLVLHDMMRDRHEKLAKQMIDFSPPKAPWRRVAGSVVCWWSRMVWIIWHLNKTIRFLCRERIAWIAEMKETKSTVRTNEWNEDGCSDRAQGRTKT